MGEAANQFPWKPIDLAPRDGMNVLLFISRDGWTRYSVGYFDFDKYAKKPRPYWRAQIERLHGTQWMRHYQPTHWMPLPEPPEAT